MSGRRVPGLRSILHRDFSSVARRPSSYVARVAVLGMPLLGAALACGMPFARLAPDVAGRWILGATGHALVAGLALVVPAMAADVIVSERAGHRLDVLRTTPLGGRGIVAGKWLSRTLLVLLLLVAAFPVLASSVLFGGVRPAQVLCVMAVAAATALWTNAAATCASAAAASFPKATSSSYGLVVGILFFTALPAMSLIPVRTRPGPVDALCAGANPFVAVASIVASTSTIDRAQTALASALSSAALSWFLLRGARDGVAAEPTGFAASAVRTMPCAYDSRSSAGVETTTGATATGIAAPAAPAPPAAALAAAAPAPAAWRSNPGPAWIMEGGMLTPRAFARRRDLLWRRPATWLEAARADHDDRYGLGCLTGLILTGMELVFLVALLIFVDRPEPENAHAFPLGGALLIGLMRAARAGAVAFHRDGDAHTRDVLFASPLPDRCLARAKAVVVLRAARPWWFLAAAHALFGLAIGHLPLPGVLAHLALAALVLAAAGALGLAIGLRTTNGMRAATATMVAMAVLLVVLPALTLGTLAAAEGATDAALLLVGYEPLLLALLPVVSDGTERFALAAVLLHGALYALFVATVAFQVLPRRLALLRAGALSPAARVASESS